MGTGLGLLAAASGFELDHKEVSCDAPRSHPASCERTLMPRQTGAQTSEASRWLRLKVDRFDCLHDPGDFCMTSLPGPCQIRSILASSARAPSASSNSKSIITRFWSSTDRDTEYLRTPDPFLSAGSLSKARFQPSKFGTECWIRKVGMPCLSFARVFPLVLAAHGIPPDALRKRPVAALGSFLSG